MSYTSSTHLFQIPTCETESECTSKPVIAGQSEFRRYVPSRPDFPFKRYPLPTKEGAALSMSRMKQLLPTDLSSLTHQDREHLKRQLLQCRKHVEVIVSDAAASLTLMYAINEARKIDRFIPGTARPNNFRSTSEYLAAQETLRSCMPMTSQFSSRLSNAWQKGAKYMSDPSNSDQDVIANLVIPDSISRARLIRGENPEDFKTVFKAVSPMPRELSSINNIYKDRYERRRKAKEVLDKVSRLVMFQAVYDLEEFEKDIAELSTKHWMTDTGDAAELGSRYGHSRAWSMSVRGDPTYVEEEEKAYITEKYRGILRLMSECQERIGTDFVPIRDLMRFAWSTDYRRVLESSEVFGSSGSREKTGIDVSPVVNYETSEDGELDEAW